MLLVPSKRSPSVAHQILSPKRALRVMKEKHVENAGTLPSSVTARVSNAIRAEGRVVVARVFFDSQPALKEGCTMAVAKKKPAKKKPARKTAAAKKSTAKKTGTARRKTAKKR
jgi:hypothetical protein